MKYPNICYIKLDWPGFKGYKNKTLNKINYSNVGFKERVQNKDANLPQK